MKVIGGLVLAIGVLALAMVLGMGCGPYSPPPCAANDRSCLPCTNPWSTNPSCPPWPNDDARKRPDGGTDR